MKIIIDKDTSTGELLTAMAEIAKHLKTRFTKGRHRASVSTIIDNINWLSRVEAKESKKIEVT